MFIFNRTGSSAARADLGKADARSRLSSVVALGLMLTAIVLAAPRFAAGQVLYGSLTGNVTDQKGAAVPGAKVELVNVGTGATRSTTTDDHGGYSFTVL